MNIGDTIHEVRKERKITLVQLAEKSGVALATLSRMENNKMTGTLESHMRICKVLGITLPDLYKNLYPPRKAVDIHAKKPKADVFIHDRKSSEEMLASKVLDKKMMPVLVHIRKGGKTQKQEAKTGIEEFVYVTGGKIEAVIGDEKYILGRNDSLYFEGNIPHYFVNIGNDEASFLTVVAPPTL